jgi:hypothetical protein
MATSSAKIVIFPIIPIVRISDTERFDVALSRKDWGRLRRRAYELGVTPNDVAAGLIVRGLETTPHKGRVP